LRVDLWFSKWHQLRQAKHEIAKPTLLDSKLGNHPSLNSDGLSSFQQILLHLLNVNVHTSQKQFPIKFCCFFQPKKTEEIWNFIFFSDANSTSFSFFGKLIFQIFYCKILNKETLLQGESKQFV
jgi:hypothetical protein